MKKRPLLAHIEIPTDYADFVDFINRNSNLIRSDTEHMSRILEELNTRLNNAENPSDLHHDSSMMLATIRFHQEIFFKEYQHNLGIEKLVDLTNNGAFDKFFEISKTMFMKAKFVDQLDLSYLPKDPLQRTTRKCYDRCTDPANVPETLTSIEGESGQSQSIVNIKDLIKKHGQVDYFKLILDKESYSKTIYNAFNLALAIRMKAVSLVTVDDVVYVAQYTQKSSEVDHSVLEITPNGYKNLISKFSIEKSLL